MHPQKQLRSIYNAQLSESDCARMRLAASECRLGQARSHRLPDFLLSTVALSGLIFPSAPNSELTIFKPPPSCDARAAMVCSIRAVIFFVSSCSQRASHDLVSIMPGEQDTEDESAGSSQRTHQ